MILDSDRPKLIVRGLNKCPNQTGRFAVEILLLIHVK